MTQNDQVENAGDNRFSLFLRDPSFFVLVELGAGEAEAERELLRAVSGEKRVLGTLVDDVGDGQNRLVEDAVGITAKPVVAVLSGRGRGVSDMEKRADELRRLGLRDFLAVSGDLDSGASGNAESVETLELLRGSSSAGAVVNPFKYLHEEQLLQVTKMARKIHAGAQFIVAQTGWDMAKFQELVWFMRSRELLVPLVARIPFLEPHRIEQGQMLAPGVPIPFFLAASASRKEELPETALTRTAQMALGCNLMGYSGVILNGIKSPAQLTQILDKIDEARAQTPGWGGWVKAWNARHQGVSFLPFGGKLVDKTPFYLYHALMEPDIPAFDLYAARPAQESLPMPPLRDILLATFTSPSTPSWIRRAAGFLGRGDATSPCLGLDNADCPKRLLHGACGGSRIDGTCEDGHGPCFFQRVMRLAVWKQKRERLEGNSHD